MSRGLVALSSAAALAALTAYYYPTQLSLSAFTGVGETTAGGPGALAPSARAFVAQEFDYVVVGGGTAGLVLAARLSEDVRVRVAVLETGGYVSPGADPRIDWIINYGAVFGDPKYDWNLKSVPQEGLGGRMVDETACVLSLLVCVSLLLVGLTCVAVRGYWAARV